MIETLFVALSAGLTGTETLRVERQRPVRSSVHQSEGGADEGDVLQEVDLLGGALLWIFQVPEVVHSRQRGQEEQDQHCQTHYWHDAEQHGRAARYEHYPATYHREPGKGHVLRTRVTAHHADVLEVVESAHDKEPAEKDPSYQQDNVHNLHSYLSLLVMHLLYLSKFNIEHYTV